MSVTLSATLSTSMTEWKYKNIITHFTDALTGVGAKDTCMSKNLFIDTSYSCYLSDKSTFEIVLPPFLPRDHQPMEYIIEGEIDDVVQPEDDRGGQDRGVDNEDGEEEEGETEERPGHEVA